MINSSDWAKYAPEKKPEPKKTIIDTADELVDIRELYNGLMSTIAPMGEYSSWKIFCPFAYEHADGGLDKNCRLYPPTHIYCWAMHGIITPTKLFSRWKGMSRKHAAEQLLEERGLLAAKNFRETWDELMQLREDRYDTRLGNKQDAVFAVQQALVHDSLYQENEYTEAVRQAWVLVLAKLDMVWSRPETTVENLNDWFMRSVTRLALAAKEAENERT